MPTVKCANPSCGKVLQLVGDTPAGTVYSCPGCHQPLPPCPAAELSPPASVRPRGFRSPIYWRWHWNACGIILGIIALVHLASFHSQDTAIQQAAVAGNACFWLLFCYLLFRTSAHSARPPGI